MNRAPSDMLQNGSVVDNLLCLISYRDLVFNFAYFGFLIYLSIGEINQITERCYLTPTHFQEEKRFYEIDWDLMTLSTHWKMQKFNMDFEIIISFLGSSSQFKVPENENWLENQVMLMYEVERANDY